MVLFATHIPFVVNHTFNSTPPERLQQYKRYIVADMKVTERLIAWQALTNTVCDKLLNVKSTQ